MTISGAKFFLLAIEVPLFLGFLLAGIFYFKSTSRNPWILATKVFGLLTILAHWWAAWILGAEDFTPVSLVGLAFLFLSETLFLWTFLTTRGHRLAFAFDEKKSDFLIQSGPYRWVRHPYYLSYSLAWVGSFLVTMNWLLVVPSALMIGLYLKAIEQEEEAFQSSPVAEEFKKYKSRTGRLLPRWGRSKP